MSRAAECIRAYRQTGDSTDVLGSYTGIFRDSECEASASSISSAVNSDEREMPVQDADDL